MAVTLNIELTDTQQAIMVALSPDGTAAEKKKWAERVAAQALRNEVGRLHLVKLRADAIAAREAADAAIVAEQEAAQSTLDEGWPE